MLSHYPQSSEDIILSDDVVKSTTKYITSALDFISPSTWLMRSVGSFLHLLHVLDLQINLKLVSNDSPNPKTLVWYQNYVSKPKLQFHSTRSFWAFYRPSTLFLAFRSIWGSWKWSPMIPLTQRHSVWYQNCFSSTIWTRWKCPKNPSICLSLCGLPVYR